MPGIGQDLMSDDHLKEYYYRESAQHLNAAERVGRESGENVNETLAFLTRGQCPYFRFASVTDPLQAFNSWLHVPWMMPCDRLMVFLP